MRAWGPAAAAAGAWAPLAIALAGFALLAAARPGPERIWGDEGTFLAMTASLARDGDLLFDERDRDWAVERVPEEGVTVILQRAGRGLAYSKPVLYPLLAAPLYRVAGEASLPLVNLLAMTAAAALAWRALARLGSPRRASLTLATFLGASVLVPYLGWRMSDSLQVALALAGLALGCGGLAGEDRPGGVRWRGIGSAAVAGLLLGLAAAMRMPNAALAAGACGANLATGRRRRAVVLVAAALAAFAVGGALGERLTGAANPYKALRTSFNLITGYPVGPPAAAAADTADAADAGDAANAANAAVRFETQTNTSRIGWRPAARAPRIAYAALYFLVGRHTGLLLYFPAALLLAAAALARPDRRSVSLLVAAAAMVVFTLVWIPWNYFGGSTFLGNRYFLTAYPALLFALPALPRPERLAPVWALFAAALVSAGISVARPDTDRMASQSHAAAGVFRLLPYESTARRIDGGRDAYWAGDFVRFVDPWATTAEYAFGIESDRPPTELLVATHGDAGAIVLLVKADRPDAELTLSDWGRDSTYRLGPAAVSAARTVIFEPSAAWRRHRFWWTDETTYRARTMRLAVRSPAGEPVTAEVRYLGNGRLLRRFPTAQRIAGNLPVDAVAGATDTVRLTLRNSGEIAWERRGLLPVRLGYRLYRDGSERPTEGRRRQLIADVPPGGEIEVELEIRWPKRQGGYRLVVDLVREGGGWFGDRSENPLAETVVQVRPADG